MGRKAVTTKATKGTEVTKKPSARVFTSTECANALGISTKQFRAIIRTIPPYDDLKYTRYGFRGKELDRVMKLVKAQISS